MRPLRALLIYLAFVFLGGALIAPWLWHLAQLFAHEIPKIAAAPFHRYLDRAFLILALIGIWPLMRALGATTPQEVGIVPPYGQMNKLFGGIALGIISLAVVAGIEIAFGARHFNPNATAHQIISAIFLALGIAIAVSIIEEILFRGAIFGGLRRVFGWPIALVVSSLIFALLHFLKRADIVGTVNWNSGFMLLPKIFDFHGFVPEFLGLTLVGAILALAYQRTGNLYFPIGLHGGWIFILKIFDVLTIQSASAMNSFWGSAKMVDGWLAFLILIATLVVFKFLPLDRRLPYSIK
jgi:membrane protease YdiL (CAAX protease family)